MYPLIAIALLLYLIVLTGYFRPRKKIVTERIGIVFHTEKSNMAAPSTGTTNNGTPLFATIQPLQASGANSNGVVSNLAVTLTGTAATAAVSTSASGVSFVTFTTVAIGSVTAVFTATVTDPDGTVTAFTTAATVTVTAGAGDVLTASIEVLFSSTVPA
jgi:hypothetical protein